MKLKQRFIGILVIIALAVIIVPVFVNHSEQPDAGELKLSSRVPKPPAKPIRHLEIKLPPETQTVLSQQPLSVAVTQAPGTVASPAATATQPSEQSVQNLSKSTKVKTLQTTTTHKPKIVPPPAQAWVVQLGSFSDKVNAENLVKKLKAGGFTAYVNQKDVTRGKLIRVFVGPEIQRVKAQQIAERIEKMFNLKGIVVKYKV